MESKYESWRNLNKSNIFNNGFCGGEMNAKHLRMASLDNGQMILYNEVLVQEKKLSFRKMNGQEEHHM